MGEILCCDLVPPRAKFQLHRDTGASIVGWGADDDWAQEIETSG